MVPIGRSLSVWMQRTAAGAVGLTPGTLAFVTSEVVADDDSGALGFLPWDCDGRFVFSFRALLPEVLLPRGRRDAATTATAERNRSHLLQPNA